MVGERKEGRKIKKRRKRGGKEGQKGGKEKKYAVNLSVYR